MDEDNLNIEIRRFLKKVGITSQLEIEKYIRKKFAEGSLKADQTIEISMVLSTKDDELINTVKETITIK